MQTLISRDHMSVQTFSFQYGELDVSRNSLLTAMGYSQGTPSGVVDDLVDEVMESGASLCNIRGGYSVATDAKLDRAGSKVIVNGISLEVHRTVCGQLAGSEAIAIALCTAGEAVSDWSGKLMAEGDLLKGYVCDVFGSIVVESAMDRLQAALRNEALGHELQITNRYSPGYCGWSVAEQKKIFGLLPAGFCGVELTDSCLMVPRKSVSAIIGLGRTVKFNQYTCNLCDAKRCLYKNLGLKH